MAKKVQHLTDSERKFIAQKIKKLLSEGKTLKRAQGEAFGRLRRRRKAKR